MYEAAPLWEEFYRRLENQSRQLLDPVTGLVAARHVEIVTCPLCGSEDYLPRVQKNGFAYVTCARCEFVYLNPQLTQHAIQDVYNDDAVRSFFFEKLLLPHVEKAQHAEFRERSQKLKNLVRSEHPRLLDVGCAAGNFLLIARESGFDGEGLELNQLYVEYVRAHRNVTVHQKLLEDMNYPEARFDVVTLWDVLEHLPHPKNILKDIGRILSPGGIVALTTINHACINERLLKERWRYYMPPDHVCSFTPELLTSIMDECGFTVEELHHYYMFEILADEWFPPMTRLRKGFMGKMYKAASAALAGAFGLLFKTLRSGDLLTVYARKK